MNSELIVRDMLSELGFDLEGGRSMRSPAVDIEQNEKEYTFSVELPGVEKDGFKVEVHEGVLSIRGERKQESEEKTKTYVRREMSYGTFTRSFALPQDAKAEAIQASYRNGILRVSVPRAEKAKPKTVEVKVD